MALSDRYLLQLQALLPRGLAWPRTPGAVLTRLLTAFADGLARVHERAINLVEEADPRTTSELLAEWETVAGLPDSCIVALEQTQTIEQRRAALHAKLTAVGGASRAYFIDLAEKMGYPGATVTEYRPMNCNSNCNDALWSAADRFTWQLNLPSSGGVFRMNCNSPCDSPLAAWGDTAIECRIRTIKPAHTEVVFAYP